MVKESADPVAEAIGLALTGSPGPVDLERAREVRQRCRDAARPWPMPVPPELLARIGYGRWAALLAEAVAQVGPANSPTRHPGALGPDDRRLLQDRPPHW